jgi:hypothetical protein
MVAKVRERIAVSKQTMYRFRMERFSLKKLNKVEGKEQYQVEISNVFTDLENLDAEMDINRAWITVRDDIKISAENYLGYFEWYMLHHNRAWETIRENIKISAKESLGYFEWHMHLHSE